MSERKYESVPVKSKGTMCTYLAGIQCSHPALNCPTCRNPSVPHPLHDPPEDVKVNDEKRMRKINQMIWENYAPGIELALSGRRIWPSLPQHPFQPLMPCYVMLLVQRLNKNL